MLELQHTCEWNKQWIWWQRWISTFRLFPYQHFFWYLFFKRLFILRLWLLFNINSFIILSCNVKIFFIRILQKSHALLPSGMMSATHTTFDTKYPSMCVCVCFNLWNEPVLRFHMITTPKWFRSRCQPKIQFLFIFVFQVLFCAFSLFLSTSYRYSKHNPTIEYRFIYICNVKNEISSFRSLPLTCARDLRKVFI